MHCKQHRLTGYHQCPAGRALTLLGHLRFLRIQVDDADRKGCNLCEAPCLVGIRAAAAAPLVNTCCTGCLECVAACPRHASLQVRLSSSWWDDWRRNYCRLRGAGARIGEVLP